MTAYSDIFPPEYVLIVLQTHGFNHELTFYPNLRAISMTTNNVLLPNAFHLFETSIFLERHNLNFDCLPFRERFRFFWLFFG